MSRQLQLFISFAILYGTSNAQCLSNYSYSGSTDTLTFTNLSSVSNPHFYWSFGDGSGSNERNPTHAFPDNGQYLVTLYAYDTITECSGVSENWITVTKPDTFICNVSFIDTHTYFNGKPYLSLVNRSSNCAGYNISCSVKANSWNYCGYDHIDSLWGPSLFLGGMYAATFDTVYSQRIYKEYYKTIPFQFSPSVNYQDCSSNFEVTIDYQTNGALVSLTAMNKSGLDTFWITGFGSSIPIIGHTGSYLYPYVTYMKNFAWLVTHIKNDVGHTCRTRSTHTILVRNPYYKFPINCAISSHPQTQFSAIGSTAQFSISTEDDSAHFQWQQDAGLGFTSLTNAGPYSGVNTNTLTIANVSLAMNNFHYRCLVTGSPNGCHLSTTEAVLFVSTTGLNDLENNAITIYPNPAHDNFSINSESISSLPSAHLKIYNFLGEEMYSEHLNEKMKTINCEQFTKGIYAIRIKTGEKLFMRKLIIE